MPTSSTRQNLSDQHYHNINLNKLNNQVDTNNELNKHQNWQVAEIGHSGHGHHESGINSSGILAVNDSYQHSGLPLSDKNTGVRRLTKVEYKRFQRLLGNYFEEEKRVLPRILSGRQQVRNEPGLDNANAPQYTHNFPRRLKPKREYSFFEPSNTQNIYRVVLDRCAVCVIQLDF